jgi:hypothetical protein
MVLFRLKTSPASEIFSDDGFAIARRSEEFGLSRTEHKNPTRLLALDKQRRRFRIYRSGLDFIK